MGALLHERLEELDNRGDPYMVAVDGSPPRAVLVHTPETVVTQSHDPRFTFYYDLLQVKTVRLEELL